MALELTTDRLLLRRWREADREPFAALNADPQVMECYPSVLSREESDAFLDERVLPHFDVHGYGHWAVERRSDGTFVGSVGLMWQTFPAAFTPALEVGWRLARREWGQGYATEAARASLDAAFDEIGVDEVVSMTAEVNDRSAAVMRRLGMTHDRADDFDHPRLPERHRLRRHVLYRMPRDRWRPSGGRA